MALKLGKCRLCLKLGDFYSIFTEDNAVQLADMAMECARIKIYEGDGLPDKVCSECIEKLSSSYIFKQQCERSDLELRRNYVPPPGFSITPPPTRQSSDSGFSNRTDLSSQAKISSIEERPSTSFSSGKKRSRENDFATSSRCTDNDLKVKISKSRINELKFSEKRQKLDHNSTSQRGLDYEDNNVSQFFPDTDSDEPILKNDDFQCNICGKQFTSKSNLARHNTMQHGKQKNDSFVLGENAVVDIPPIDMDDGDEKLSCSKCGKTFKLKIMLKRHFDKCSDISTPKDSKTPKDSETPKTHSAVKSAKLFNCDICDNKFSNVGNLERHMRVVHANLPKKSENVMEVTVPPKKVTVPCIYCHKPFEDYYLHSVHFSSCYSRTTNISTYRCLVCNRHFNSRNSYLKHVKETHFGINSQNKNSDPGPSQTNVEESELDLYECRLCSKKIATQELLITHLAAHMSNLDDSPTGVDSGPSTQDDSISINSELESTNQAHSLKCEFCDKSFSYKKSLLTHKEKKHSNAKITQVVEIKPDVEAYTNEGVQSDESSQEDGDNTCDICEKQFSYKRLLIQHKKTKHNMSSGYKRASVSLQNCNVMCLICDITTKVKDINEHNKIHSSQNIKPRNLYTCSDCNEQFKSCTVLANHIKIVHRLKRQSAKKFNVADLADFCEVVVTKTEPLDQIQSHNDSGVPGDAIDIVKPIVNLNGFTCPLCNKTMPTLISLKRHINWHSNVGNTIEKKYECFVCKTKFRFNSHYKLHMREHYNDTNIDPKFLTCTICDRKSKHLRAAQMHMNWHKQTRFNDKDYECSICKRIFQFRKVYLSHMAIHYKRGESSQNTVVGDTFTNNTINQYINGDGEVFRCNLCGKDFGTANSLKCHMSWHKSKTSLYGTRYQCSICNLQFTNKRSHEFHLRSHYEDENGPFKCNICGKGYNDENYFRRHIKGHNFDHQSHKKRLEKLEKIREKKVKCPICFRYYPDLVKLIRHLRRTHPESKMIKPDPDAPPPVVYSCKLCAKVFHSERRLQHHEEAHLRKPEFFKCKFCGKKTISLKSHRIHIKGHLTQKHRDEPLQCSHCDERFTRGYDLHYHLRDIHDIEETWIAERGEQTLDGPLKDLQCSICFKILASKGNYGRHIDYHNSLRCNYCCDYFSSLRFLEGHLAFACEKKKLIGNTEVYPKKVKCHICYRAYHLQVKLDCHLQTQHGIKISREASQNKNETVCDFCFRVFENEESVVNHKLYHRTIGYYGCIYCNRKFGTMTLYRKHKNHHFAQLNVDDPFKCEHCDKKFEAFRDMIYHMRDDHADNKEWLVMPKESIEEKCEICGKIFFNLHRHLQYHEDNKCKKCNEYFYSMVDYDNHLCTVDSDDEPENNENDKLPKYEECKFCFKPITKTSSKLKHDLIHKNSGAISCRFCALKFKTMDAFQIHAFSHRSRKYKKNPLKCKVCQQQFVQYGPFMKHLKSAHKIVQKMHYRTTVLPERCVICGDDFPNLHNHYRAHLQNQCQLCRKYFTSSRLLTRHNCDLEDADPAKVFVSDEDLLMHINAYIPKDENCDQKYYCNTDDEEIDKIDESEENCFETDQVEIPKGNELPLFPISIQSPIISDVLSLYRESLNEEKIVNVKSSDDNNDVVEIIDDSSVDFDNNGHVTIVLDE